MFFLVQAVLGQKLQQEHVLILLYNVGHNMQMITLDLALQPQVVHMVHMLIQQLIVVLRTVPLGDLATQQQGCVN